MTAPALMLHQVAQGPVIVFWFVICSVSVFWDDIAVEYFVLMTRAGNVSPARDDLVSTFLSKAPARATVYRQSWYSSLLPLRGPDVGDYVLVSVSLSFCLCLVPL